MRNKQIYLANAVIIMLCLTGFIHVWQKAGLPVIFKHNSLIIEHIKNENLPLRFGDKIVSIDGQNVKTQEELEFILDSKAVDESVDVSFLRDSSKLNFRALLENYYSLRYLIIQAIVSGVFIILGIFVFVKRKEDETAKIFNLVLSFSALIIAATWGRYTVEPNWIGLTARLSFNAAYAFTAILFFHFTMLFPDKKPILSNKTIYTLYFIGFILTGLMTYTFLIAAANKNLLWFNFYNSIFNYTRLFFAFCVVISLINIVHSYLTAIEESHRRKMRWILLGLFIGPIFLVTLWIIPQIITSRGLIDEEYILLAMLSVPIAFTVSIVKYHILNIDEIFKRSTVYLFAFFSVLLIYIIVVGFGSLLIGVLTVKVSLFISTIAAIIIAALFNPIKEKVQSFVDKKLFNVSYNYREAETQFIEKLKLCYDEASIRSIAIETIQNLIPNDNTRIRFTEGEKQLLSAEQIEHFSKSEKLSAIVEHIEYGAKYNKAEKELFMDDDIVLGIRIYSELNGLYGVMFLGRKKSGFRYNIEDIDLLKVFCYQIALTFDRIKLQKKLITEEIEKSRLKELNELKSYFVSSVSHELKTPLTSIKMFSELMEESPNIKLEKRKEYLRIIKGESSRLSRLIDNVLDITKIEKGIKEYYKSIIDLNDCINDAVAIMEYQLNLNGFETTIELTNEDTAINADYDAVVEVIINLISNSIKYSAKQKKIKLHSIQQNGYVILSVEDNGVGIAEDEINKIFHPFERAKSMTSGKTTGTGLGLAIVKHIVQAHKAQIEVKSQVGIGSTFSIIFPTYKGE